ncbi:aldo/keto reductase [Xanthomonas bonasiae]|uniref:aldo/keto reductase n=1 Tax=Xanthomonas bonasiae TaxID=2810351 RepID=UPI00178122F5|nr:aldo/keto reductase [Xanthomonas surreyensis]MBD7922375.1 aldo/keto reductase [Xanthomonas surreyensis]
MQYAQLGATGIFVSRLCLGAMTFGGSDNPAGNAIGRLTATEADGIVGQALDAGINFLDTADVYGGGGSEALLGDVLKTRRNQIVLATKGGAKMGSGPNETGQSRVHLMGALTASLQRLKTDHIDLYQLHSFDPLTPLDSVLRTLDDAVRQGKIRHIGCSNFAAWQLTKALGIAERDKLEKFVSIQSFYSLAGRDIEDEVIPAATDQNVSLLCWSPLAGGLLSGKFDRHGAADPNARRAKIHFPPVDEPKALDIIDTIKQVAQRRDAEPAQVALAWLLSRPTVTSVIVGIKTAQQLSANLQALDVVLDDEDLDQLDAVSSRPVAYPGWIQTYNAQARVPKTYPFKGRSWALGQKPI